MVALALHLNFCIYVFARRSHFSLVALNYAWKYPSGWSSSEIYMLFSFYSRMPSKLSLQICTAVGANANEKKWKRNVYCVAGVQRIASIIIVAATAHHNVIDIASIIAFYILMKILFFEHFSRLSNGCIQYSNNSRRKSINLYISLISNGTLTVSHLKTGISLSLDTFQFSVFMGFVALKMPPNCYLMNG